KVFRLADRTGGTDGLLRGLLPLPEQHHPPRAQHGVLRVVPDVVLHLLAEAHEDGSATGRKRGLQAEAEEEVEAVALLQIALLDEEGDTRVDAVELKQRAEDV